MTPIAYYRSIVMVTGMSAVIVLSACQPASEPKSASIEVAQPIEVSNSNASSNDTTDSHAEHNMSASDMVADQPQMTAILKDYTKSMTQMHEEMMVGMSYNDPDTAFAKSMLGHHRGALDMAKIELKYGTDVDMRTLAQQIIPAQQTDIDTLRKWLASHPDISDPKPSTQAMQQALADTMSASHNEMMAGISDPTPDVAFARGMLPHHISAVAMAKVQLKYGTNAEMLKLAQDIITAQQPEIEQMQEWIARRASNEDISINDTDNAESVDSMKAIKPSA